MEKHTIAPFRVDHVGSFLRPDVIKKARQEVANGTLAKTDLRKIEDAEITKLVQKQKELGLHGITDGEFRRGWWHIDFLEHLTGVEGYVPDTGYNQAFKGTHAPSYNIRVIDKVAFNPAHPFLEDFKFLKEAVGEDSHFIAKATIPSPNMLLRQELLSNFENQTIATIYPEIEEFYQDLAKTYQDAIQAFYQLGCRYLQFDDTNWAFLADETKRNDLLAHAIDPDQITQICTEIINQALKNKPADMVITTHICRGNFASSWIFSGGYAPIAKNLFQTNYDGFFLEYDSDRSGDFEPLRYWQNNGSKVVLGLITSKTPALENQENVIQRIQEATAYIPLENLALSPQCGFASTEEGNKLTETEQWAKIDLIQTIAEKVWNDVD